MSKQRKGGWRTISERRYMRIRIGESKRPVVPLTGVRTDDDADARCALIADAVADLLAAGLQGRVEHFARELGAARTAARLANVRTSIAQAIELGSVAPKGVLFRDWAGRWTSGELARMYPDHVKAKDSGDDEGKLDKYILPHVGHVPVAHFTLENAEYVMSKIPVGKSAATRRHVAQIMHRLLVMAVYPGKLLAASPLPKGFLPKLGGEKAKPYLYPDEDAVVMACTAIPLERRIAYGILAREGMRAGELLGNEKQERPPMAWRDVDRDRGLFRLDVNKTDEPRAWAADPGVARVLRAWYERCGEPGIDSAIVPPIPRLAEQLRADLETALGERMRPELLERSAARARLVAHHLRATFVTLALANGKTETWVQDRTGHTSSAMINRYRRMARTAAELHLGPLQPLDKAIPEFRSAGGAKVGQKSSQKRGPSKRSK